MSLSDLPKDLLEEILIKVPVRSIRTIRSICKDWNTLSYDQSFTKKLFGKTIATKDNESMVVLMMGCNVYLMSFNLFGIHKDDNNVGSSIMHKAKLNSLSDDLDYQVDNISTVYHCDGLLLCITIVNKMNIRIVVWNPYIGQTRLIKPKNAYMIGDRYALGYEEKSNSPRIHKILRFNNEKIRNTNRIYEFEIYNLYFDSWKVFNLTLDLEIFVFQCGVSLQGNTYWLARERFGHRLPMPFHSYSEDTVNLSSVREEKLALLLKRSFILWRIEIWVTTKIEPQELTWNKFFDVNMEPLTHPTVNPNSFFIDEKKNVVVVFDVDKYNVKPKLAYIIGKDGYVKEVDLGETRCKSYCGYPLVCSYVPSLVQVKKVARAEQCNSSMTYFFGKHKGLIGLVLIVVVFWRRDPVRNAVGASAEIRCRSTPRVGVARHQRFIARG
ncbi:hypothetical protein CARUB_v10011988mg [Capsella rubella]|uniref:F-box domain-containing protein n=1 Tax=Capsella rubella TaxID=81985 RepID=R0I663_9BRAS|nr:hypothetical protein CARUB_v10011988mg [Capsella rubella]